MNYSDRKAVIDSLYELRNRLLEVWESEDCQFAHDDEYKDWVEILEIAVEEMTKLNNFIKEMN